MTLSCKQMYCMPMMLTARPMQGMFISMMVSPGKVSLSFTDGAFHLT